MKLLTTDELANELRVHVNSLANWRKQGMPCLKVGRNWRYELEAVKVWLKTHKGGN